MDLLLTLLSCVDAPGTQCPQRGVRRCQDAEVDAKVEQCEAEMKGLLAGARQLVAKIAAVLSKLRGNSDEAKK